MLLKLASIWKFTLSNWILSNCSQILFVKNYETWKVPFYKWRVILKNELPLTTFFTIDCFFKNTGCFARVSAVVCAGTMFRPHMVPGIYCRCQMITAVQFKVAELNIPNNASGVIDVCIVKAVLLQERLFGLCKLDWSFKCLPKKLVCHNVV